MSSLSRTPENGFQPPSTFPKRKRPAALYQVCRSAASTCSTIRVDPDSILGYEPFELEHTQTVRVAIGPIAQQLLKDLGWSLVRDLVNCITLKADKWKTAYAWVTAEFAAPFAIGAVARAIAALRVSLRTGVGITEALAAVRATPIDAATLVKLERDVNRSLAARCLTSAARKLQTRAANPVGRCPVTGLPHGDLGEAATFSRLESGGYTNIVPRVRFINSRGDVFIADFVAKGPDGKWIAVEVKTNNGPITPGQQVGYPELEDVGAILNTDKLQRFGFEKGDVIKMPVTFDAWTCPSCAP